MINAGMSFKKSPNVQKPREQFVNGMQKNKFARTVKKNKSNIAQRSHIHVQHRNEVSDSYDEPQPEHGNIAIVVKPPKKHVSPRTMNARLSGITRRNSDMHNAKDQRV